MNYLKQNHLSILIIVFLVVSSLSGSSSVPLLGALDSVTFTNPVRFNSTVTTTGATTFTGDATFNGGDGGIVVTTSNTATSSVETGCIQMTATSTASPIKLVPVATATTTTTFGFGTSGFVVVAVFGTCP